jgi:hypothetical protein
VTAVATVPAGDPEADTAAGTEGAAQTTPEAAPDSVATTDFDFDSLVSVIQAEAAEPRRLSVLPFGIAWTPAAPIEGSAIAFRVLQPRGGLEPQAVVGRFADRVVRFGRMGGTWLGLAAAPIDTYGPLQLELEFRFGDGSMHRQVGPKSRRRSLWIGDRSGLFSTTRPRNG